MKINRLQFDPKGSEDIRAFAARLDSLLIITGRHYEPEESITNGARAEALFRTLPAWLEAKIREQGIPDRCTHEQWCFGRVLERASLILAANKTRYNNRTSTFKPYTKYTNTTTETSTKPTPTTPSDTATFPITKPKKIFELTPKEQADMIAQNICFFC